MEPETVAQPPAPAPAICSRTLLRPGNSHCYSCFPVHRIRIVPPALLCMGRKQAKIDDGSVNMGAKVLTAVSTVVPPPTAKEGVASGGNVRDRE
ncbi:hypothetical protein [Sodalis-like endosymbiont of Proechinophthirus fluctus]|uniref:hypothetical protein n=1 Tax=Sodalis-like endosymbiont of Proechinophthirus fluctus TaxID=1462730 RepID=UPI001FCB19F1|nr:hypothetical protein [Sodalis-like endosymbiont of Proechinophthirus fluctus]